MKPGSAARIRGGGALGKMQGVILQAKIWEIPCLGGCKNHLVEGDLRSVSQAEEDDVYKGHTSGAPDRGL